ncbi:MAG: asparagine synthase (glutamine-hydrolyzing) [Flavobacteriaceae bacterium]|nr:asparagine synthase (glutamine-hydrolyzing) [Flavobacteriaceae bacterium]
MCGIAGFFGKPPQNSDSVIKHMLSRIKHRGPDESGFYQSNIVTIGSVRLSIIDLANGSMPIPNKNKTLWIVFNGEIFNYIELREELKQKGYNFDTSTDTEVIVNLYQEYGTQFVNKLNGQFSIAIWDKTKEELFLARDRVGIRPLYYTELNGSFVFASEMKSFLEFPEMTFMINPKALAQYFTFWTSITPTTVFKNIYELPPGSYMIISKKGKQTYKYWQLPIFKKDQYVCTELEKAIKTFEELFQDAVKIRLRADVPVAAYLSGGIDSSITTSFIKSISPNNLKTYSIGFEEDEFDESSYQKIASDYFNTNHSSVTCSAEQIAIHFEHVVWHCEAPLLRTAPVPMYLLAESVRKDNTKVVITGEGADELLGGYNIFKETKIRQFWAKNPQSKYRPLLLKKLYPYLPQMKNANNSILKMFFGYKLEEISSPIYSHILRWNNTSRILNYLSKDCKETIGKYNAISELNDDLDGKLTNDHDYLTKAQFIEINIFMTQYLLSSQGDRMTMANSVEGRYPFLDHRVVEFCMSLHPDLKLKMLNEKYLLKKMMNERLPNEILYRSKQAYRAPVRSVFNFSTMPDRLKDLLTKSSIEKSAVFDYDKVNILFKRFKENIQLSEIDNMALTAIISTQLLVDQYVNRNLLKFESIDLIKPNKIVKE